MRIRAYTDGACSGNPGPGGWAAIILLAEDQQVISGFENDTTNNKMELKAVIETIKLVQSMYLYTPANTIKLDVYSDSAYVVDAVRKGWIKKWMHRGWMTSGWMSESTPVKNADLWKQLYHHLNGTVIVNLIKVAGHSGDKYNEIVDQAAKREIKINKAW